MDFTNVYELSMVFSQKIWIIVGDWPVLPKDTVGKQIIRSSDSISANLMEGYGRYSFKERNVFYIFSRGSLFETRCWIQKSHDRKLIDEPVFLDLVNQFEVLQMEINRLIRITREHSNRKIVNR